MTNRPLKESRPFDRLRASGPFDKYILSAVEGLRVSGFGPFETKPFTALLSLSKHWWGFSTDC